MRFFIGMLSHETNTFSTIEILEGYRGTGTCLGGMIGVAEARGVTLLPSLAAAAAPAGRVSRDFYEEARERLLATLLHGYKTYPHVDMAERGAEAAARLIATVTLDVGGKIDPRHGAPLRVPGRVGTLSDGRFVHKGPMFRGLEGRRGPIFPLDDI